MAVTEEPILSRLDRLDNMLRQLEEMRGSNRSPKSSSCASTPSSGTYTSEGHASSSIDFSPKSLEKHCRPISRVAVETEIKGTLVERLDQVEERLLKLEGELGAERRRKEDNKTEKNGQKKKKRKGIKELVRNMVKGNKCTHKTKA